MESFHGRSHRDWSSLWFLRLIAGLSLCGPGIALAEQCDREVGRVLSAEGATLAHGQSPRSPAQSGSVVCLNTLVQVDRAGRATIELTDPAAQQANDNRPIVTLGRNSSLRFSRPDRERLWVLKLLEGWLRFFSPRPTDVDVDAAYLTAGVRGTEFVLHSQDDACAETGETEGCTVLWVQEGRVRASNDRGSIEVDAAGPEAIRTVIARRGREPELRALRITPEDAVNWVIYYLPLSQLRAPDCEADAAIRLVSDPEAAVRCGSPATAIDALERLPETTPPAARARLYGLAARRLLLAGDTGRADELLEQAIRAAPDASLYALGSVVALKRNDKLQARAAAARGIALDSGSADAQLAMSYVHQAEFDLPGARAAAQVAADHAVDDPLMAARLAELDLILGDSAAALTRADTAVMNALRDSAWTEDALDACEPGQGTPAGARDMVLSRTLTVRGSARLIRLEVAPAQADLHKAICADDRAPLARLGLGLALIRQGELDQGVRELEIAVALDPRVSLYRSYLGRGYREQARFDLAAKELALAKTYDDRDPTPWLYDAGLKLTLDRPAEALDDIRRSIELNENRAPYRSSLGLDEDMAARETGLARVHRDLGFTRLATLEAARSLDFDPAEYSAHRLLADAYRGEPRLETARASELLQAQLLQPVNANPIQPSLAFTDLGLRRITGPARAGFNEFSPLFIQDGMRLSGSGLLGNDGTVGEEVVLSGVHGNAALSAGQFHYESDGFRPDSELEHDIYNVFAQVDWTDRLGLQAEFRRRETESGDRRFMVDPFASQQSLSREAEETIFRVGARFRVSPNIDLLASLIDADNEEDLTSISPFFPITVATGESDAQQIEAQFLVRTDAIHWVLGGGSYTNDGETVTELFGLEFPSTTNVDAWNIYVYGTAKPMQTLTVTLGLGYEDYRDKTDAVTYEVSKFAPKIGLAWQPNKSLRARVAASRGVKRDLAVDQTIEPTALVGFNQLYDDFNGTVSDSYSAGLDWSGVDVWLGVEAGRRESSPPVFVDSALGGSVFTNDHDENVVRAYAYWKPLGGLTLSADLQYSDFEQERQILGPAEVETFLLPVGITHRRGNGLYSQLRLSYFHQRVKNRSGSISSTMTDSATLLDVALGVRIPERSIDLGVAVNNLFDSEFEYQDDSFRSSSDQLDPLFLPSRSVVAYLSVSF